MNKCELCPRCCRVDRLKEKGVCGVKESLVISKIMLHHWEEPCISGGEGGIGSGAVFFSGCSLKCVYCQNKAISRHETGVEYTAEELAKEILTLQKMGAYNINFVSPTHYTDKIINALETLRTNEKLDFPARSAKCSKAKSKKEESRFEKGQEELGSLSVPVVWNTSGYEREEVISSLAPYVDVFLTDFKYCSKELSSKYSNAPDYAEYAQKALAAMVKITGKPEFDGKTGLIKRGTIVRHLVLPGARADSIDVLHLIKDTVGAENVVLSLMSQYTPEFLDNGYPEINRRLTTFEYNKVLDEAIKLGFDGYFQNRASASSKYTPDF